MTRVVFHKWDTDEVIGAVEVTDGELHPDPNLQDLVEGHLRSGFTADQFVERYDGWGNGYIWSAVEG